MRLAGVLSLFFVLVACSAAGGQKKRGAATKGVMHPMTVMNIEQPTAGADYYGIAFTVSQRVYRLPKSARASYLRLLKQSQQRHVAVRVWRAREDSDVIIRVER
jgi:hypothetical protein